jgi:hypothetical protein
MNKDKSIVKSDEVNFIVPQGRKEDLIKFDRLIRQARTELDDALTQGNDTLAAMIQVQAYKALEQAITPEILKDFRMIENTDDGFKTDRDPNRPQKKDGRYETPSPYPDLVIKRVLISALSKGARVVGNEFNVIAGNLYLTKQYYIPRVKLFPGLTELRILWGVPTPSQGGRGWLYPVKASWKLQGRPDAIECTMTKDFDSRIVVRGYETSSVDEIRGRAEARLFRLIFERVSGINVEAGESFEAFEEVAEPIVVVDCDKLPEPPRQRIESQPGQQSLLPGSEDPAILCAKLLNEFEALLGRVTDRDSVSAIVEERMCHVEDTDWPNQVKNTTKQALNRIAKARFEALDK